MSKPIAAGAAFRRGDRSHAFQILGSFIDELLELDMMSGTAFACIEFINMMTKIDRSADAQRILGYLETTGLLEPDASPFGTLVADAASKIAANPGHTPDQQPHGRDLDDRHALAYMRDVLHRLLADVEMGW